MSIRVTCINKSGGYHENPHEAISNLGWSEDGTGKSGRMTREEMWQWVSDGRHAYVKDAYGNTARVQAKTNGRGTHYVQTESDGRPTDNLLKLGEC